MDSHHLMTRSDYAELVPLQQYKCLGSAVTYLYPNIPKSIWIHIDHVYGVCARVRGAVRMCAVMMLTSSLQSDVYQ